MKYLFLFALLVSSYIGCDADENDEADKYDEEIAPIIGTWELYLEEHLKTSTGVQTGMKSATVNRWYQSTGNDSKISLEFKDNGTFIERHANMDVADGFWGITDEGTYYFEYILKEENKVAVQKGRRLLSMYCPNTSAIENEKNNRAIFYYRLIGTSECADVIDYHVDFR